MSSCSHCDDTGFVIRAIGGVERAARCPCRSENAGVRRLETARIPRRYASCSIETFVPQPGQEIPKRVAEEFLSDYPLESGSTGLLFLGAPGVGKTHLAVSVLRTLIIEKGVQGL